MVKGQYARLVKGKSMNKLRATRKQDKFLYDYLECNLLSFLLSFFNKVDLFKLGFTEWTGGHADTNVYFSINQILDTDQQEITVHLLTLLA